ncbi:MAG: DUF1450 domain-containing protein [Tumebacillaceae bacterium]
MVIEICETNEARELVRALRRKYPAADVVVHSCLHLCSGCFLCLFVLVDGEPVEAFSPEQLLEKIEQFISST